MQLSWKSPKDFIQFKSQQSKKLADATVLVTDLSPAKAVEKLSGTLLQWQLNKLNERKEQWSDDSYIDVVTESGPLTVFFTKNILHADLTQEGSVGCGSFGRGRDLLGSWLNAKQRSARFVRVLIEGKIDSDFAKGMLCGLEMAGYGFKSPSSQMLQIEWVEAKPILKPNEILRAKSLGSAVNLARNLVDLPPNQLNPTTYAQFIKTLFNKSKQTMKVEVWDQDKLDKERMHLHLAVGRGAEFPPALVKLTYRGSAKNAKKPATVFVGKGITFDSGGLDIKPSAGMRLMKKDMGGSATVVALAYYLNEVGAQENYDFYLPLAENAVDSRSFRPGDILSSRSGKTIEIHNTDAEGRLVLADALQLATESSSKPLRIIDVATLTGAVKQGLGAEVMGYFSTDSQLASQIQTSADKVGEPAWQLPLYQGYLKQLQSPVADMVNAVDGFGGAITAALFLKQFVNGVPWAHFDIYAWLDRPSGPYGDLGGSGQAVQTLAELLQEI